MVKYRIATDNYAGYEVQIWRWWWPFWVQAGFTNTHCDIHDAEKWAERHRNSHVVKYL